MNVCLYIYVYVCIYMYVCIYIYIYKKLKCQLLSHVQLFVSPWTVACKSPLSMEFSRQEYWSEEELISLLENQI